MSLPQYTNLIQLDSFSLKSLSPEISLGFVILSMALFCRLREAKSEKEFTFTRVEYVRRHRRVFTDKILSINPVTYYVWEVYGCQ